MARLIFRDSQGREGTVELSPTETVYVGRGLECAIRTDDGMVSRRHAQFRNENGRYVVEDLGSANGTHLNNAFSSYCRRRVFTLPLSSASRLRAATLAAFSLHSHRNQSASSKVCSRL